MSVKMSTFLDPVLSVYDYALAPVPVLAPLGVHVSALDIAGALRLALVLRQMREKIYKQHLAKRGANGLEPRSRTRDIAATLVMVYGGEAVVGMSLETTMIAYRHPLSDCL